MAIAGDGFPCRVWGVLRCERGNLPEYSRVVMLVLVLVCVGTVVLGRLLPGPVEAFATCVEAVAPVVLPAVGAVFGLGLLVLCGFAVAGAWRVRRSCGVERSGQAADAGEQDGG